MPEETRQWEYRVQKIGSIWSGVKPEEMEEMLNQWGLEGWEVVSAVGFENTNKITVIATRALSERIRRQRSMPQ